MFRNKACVVGIMVSFFMLLNLDAATPESLSQATHKQVRVIAPKLEDADVNLNTFAMAPNGKLWLCCSTARGLPSEKVSMTGVILIYDVTGEFDRSILLDFNPQAINFSANGTPFIAGSGKVARLKIDGQVDLVVDAPNLLDDDQMKEKLAKKTEKMIELIMESRSQQLKRVESQIAILEKQIKAPKAKDSNERLADRNAKRLAVLKKQRDTLISSSDEQRNQMQEMYASTGVAQVKLATGLAVTSKDVFVSLPSLEGHGYAIHRMSHDLTDAKIVKEDAHGCCGQLDIQSDGEHLLIAENSSFKVGIYDREGKSVRSFGERAQAIGSGKSNLEGWGSCCNPMNIRCLEGGEILVAESSIGHIKRYTSEGQFLGIVGTAKIAGGCKHVAITKDPARDWYFMMNTSSNNIAVLVPRAEAPSETEDERESRLAMEGLGQKLIGSWRLEESKEIKEKKGVKLASAEGDEVDSEESDSQDFDYADYIVKQNRFLRLDSDGKVSRQEKPTTIASTKTETKSTGFWGTIASLFTGEIVTTTIRTSESDEPTRWIPIKQEGDVIQFAMEESEVRNNCVAVRFIDDNRAEFKWYYDEVNGEPLATVSYVRVEGGPVACSPGKECSTTECAKPADAKNVKTISTPEVPSSEAPK